MKNPKLKSSTKEIIPINKKRKKKRIKFLQPQSIPKTKKEDNEYERRYDYFYHSIKWMRKLHGDGSDYFESLK